jgi:hypothetical protein
MKLSRKAMPLKVTLDAMFNPIASTIPKWWTINLLKWMENLHQSMWVPVYEILYANRSSEDEQVLTNWVLPLLYVMEKLNLFHIVQQQDVGI